MAALLLASSLAPAHAADVACSAGNAVLSFGSIDTSRAMAASVGAIAIHCVNNSPSAATVQLWVGLGAPSANDLLNAHSGDRMKLALFHDFAHLLLWSPASGPGDLLTTLTLSARGSQDVNTPVYAALAVNSRAMAGNYALSVPVALTVKSGASGF